MDEFKNDVEHWKKRLREEGHSRGRLKGMIASAPSAGLPQVSAARELLEEGDQGQHRESMDLGGKTLCWTKVAAVAAIVGAGAALWPLIRPATSLPASPRSLPQTTTPIPVSPAAAVVSSISTPLQKQSATGVPSPAHP